MAYTDKDQLIADYIPEAKSASEIAAIGRILDSVCSFVDTYCKRVPGFFNPSPTDPTELRVRGEGNHFLRLPRHVPGSVSQVMLFGYLVDPTVYYEGQKNGWLYLENNAFGLERTFLDARQMQWIEGAIFRVTARWGYDATPADLQEAIRQTVAKVWETQKGTLGQITPDGFLVERAMPLFAREVLDKYKRREFEI